MRHGGPVITPRISLALAGAVFAWGILARAADPEVEEPAAAGAPAVHVAPKAPKHRHGKGAPSFLRIAVRGPP